jgi:hypothetical protein
MGSTIAPMVAEGQPRPGAHQARLQQRIGHPGHGLHGQNRVPDRRRGHILLAQARSGPQLPKILEGVSLLLRESARLAPTPATGGN